MKQTLKLFAVLFLLVFAFLSCELETNFNDLELQDSNDVTLRCETEHIIGGYWISPKQKTKNVGDNIKTKLRVNCGDYRIGAISVQITYNPQVITPNMAIGDKGLVTEQFTEENGGGFAVNNMSLSPTESMLFIAAYLARGVEPEPDAVLFDINWIGVAPGVVELTPNVLMSVDARDYSTAGTPIGYTSTITVQ